jgi:ATP-dependent Clp protease ATP-binding subunit ClpA
MYWRFTDRARKVMQLANQEAQRLNHEYIGTGHILLGLVKEGSGVAANVLRNLNVDLRRIRREVEKIIQSGPAMVLLGKLPMTPRAKKVIEYAIEEARGLNHEYVGTEHLLLGLARETEGVGAQVLINLGLRLDDVRAETMKLLGENEAASAVMDATKPVLPGFAERVGSWLGRHAILAIFICGVIATLSAEWIVLGLGGDATDLGAVLGGIVYVLAVALGHSVARRGPKHNA